MLSCHLAYDSSSSVHLLQKLISLSLDAGIEGLTAHIAGGDTVRACHSLSCHFHRPPCRCISSAAVPVAISIIVCPVQESSLHVDACTVSGIAYAGCNDAACTLPSTDLCNKAGILLPVCLAQGLPNCFDTGPICQQLLLLPHL